MMEDPNDTTVFATFFKSSLLDFERNISCLKEQESVVSSI